MSTLKYLQIENELQNIKELFKKNKFPLVKEVEIKIKILDLEIRLKELQNANN